MTDDATPATLLFVEHVLWEPDDAWQEAVRHLQDRFARAAPLDAATVLAAGALHLQLELLTTWASSAKVDLDRELGRWLDEHLSMHVRPAPAVTRAVRARAAAGPVHLASALPARAAESLARHAGCWRSVTELHPDLRDERAVADLLDRLAPEAVIAGGPTPLPAGTSRQQLAPSA